MLRFRKLNPTGPFSYSLPQIFSPCIYLPLFPQQVEKQKHIETNLQFRISQLEEKQSEDDMLLCGINRYWKILDENCRIFTKQFDSESSTELFDQCKLSFYYFMISSKIATRTLFVIVIFLVDNNVDSFLIQLSTWDVEELKEKLEKRVQLSKQNVEKMILALYKALIKTNTLQKLLKTRSKYWNLLSNVWVIFILFTVENLYFSRSKIKIPRAEDVAAECKVEEENHIFAQKSLFVKYTCMYNVIPVILSSS